MVQVAICLHQRHHLLATYSLPPAQPVAIPSPPRSQTEATRSAPSPRRVVMSCLLLNPALAHRQVAIPSHRPILLARIHSHQRQRRPARHSRPLPMVMVMKPSLRRTQQRRTSSLRRHHQRTTRSHRTRVAGIHSHPQVPQAMGQSLPMNLTLKTCWYPRRLLT